MKERRNSIPVRIGDVTIGGGSPVVVQSMTKTDTRNVMSTIDQIKELEECGCEIVRVAVPDAGAAKAIKEIKAAISIPLVADIHFDYRLALMALESGADGLRLNPGNIGDSGEVAEVAKSAGERGVPIRVGVNAGSLPASANADVPVSRRMVDAAMEQVRLLENMDFGLIKVSLKAFDVPATIEAYLDIARRIPYPLHVGITEAGLPGTGIIRSTAGIATLLYLGIGDTIRVSLTGDPVEEGNAGYEILKSVSLRRHGPVLVSCPSCGRAEVDIIRLAGEVEQRLKVIKRPLKVAVMGCVVNGPGEARDADIGIACGKGKAILFQKGKMIKTIPEDAAVDALMRAIDEMEG